jgi:hypothetical protein
MAVYDALDWIPLERVGPYRFGEAIAPEVVGSLKLKERDDQRNWLLYLQSGLAAKATILVENGAVITVNCFEECYYQGTNLLGLSQAQLCALIGEADDSELQSVDDEESLVLYFDKLSLMAWIDHGCVVAVDCYK